MRHMKGKTCVIDVMGWLYRGAFASTWSNSDNLGLFGYPLKMIKLLESYSIKPICVFDGRPHEGKVECERARAIDKQKSRSKAKQAEKEGNVEEAKKQQVRCLYVHQKELDLFQEILDKLGIEHITAPYEADA